MLREVFSGKRSMILSLIIVMTLVGCGAPQEKTVEEAISSPAGLKTDITLTAMNFELTSEAGEHLLMGTEYGRITG